MLAFFRSFNKSELTLLVTSSFLIAIWPMRDTIAARNILLVVCTLISIFYLYRNFRTLVWSRKQSIENWIPIILVALLFIWVLVHYFFFSYDPVAQLNELTSTWARSLMASIIGFTVGLIINRRDKGYRFVMMALISGLLVHFYQYASLLMQSGNIFQPLWFSTIYWGKINQVLVGTLFIAGALGFFDMQLIAHEGSSKKSLSKIPILTQGLFYFLGILLVFHCYVYEINSRNGVGIGGILIFLFVIKIIIRMFLKGNSLSSGAIVFKYLPTIFILLFATIFFVNQQLKANVGWQTYIEDVKIAAQVDNHNNWQTIPSAPIYSATGRQIKFNTYERTAWAVVAVRTIAKYPFGFGLIHRAFGRLVKLDYPNSDLTLSHSGFLDFGLSFGILGLCLLLGSLIWTLGLSVASKLSQALTVFWSSIGLFCVYALAEIVYYHGVEILLFWLTLMPTMIMSKKEENL